MKNLLLLLLLILTLFTLPILGQDTIPPYPCDIPGNEVFTECQLETANNQILELGEELSVCKLDLISCENNQGGYSQSYVDSLVAEIEYLQATSVSWLDLAIVQQQLKDCNRAKNYNYNLWQEALQREQLCRFDLEVEKGNVIYACNLLTVNGIDPDKLQCPD